MWESQKNNESNDDDKHYWCYKAVMDLLDIDRKDNDPSIWDRLKVL
jgi:hypothetical protein